MLEEKYDLTPLFIHLAGRSVANMEKVCMKGNCIVCNFWFEVVGVNLYEVEHGEDT